MNNLLQKIAIKYYRTIDSNGALYDTLKSMGLIWRLFIYVILIVVSTGTMYFLLAAFHINARIFDYLVWIILAGVASVCTYESIYTVNIKEIIAAQKEKENHIKKNKLQWWRLRNMRWFVRVIIYIVVYIVAENMMQVSSMLSFFSSIPHPTQYQVTEFVQAFKHILKYFTVFFILCIGLLEYFITKRRRQCKK